MNADDLHRAYRELRQRAPDEDKEALIQKLHRHPVAAAPSLFAWFERFRRPEWAGVALAGALTAMVAVGVPMYQQSNEFAPQVDELNYDDGQAMVIEDKAQHTTVIWLSDKQDDNDDDDDDEDTPQASTPEKI